MLWKCAWYVSFSCCYCLPTYFILFGVIGLYAVYAVQHHCWPLVYWNHRNTVQLNFNQNNTDIFWWKYESENVSYKMCTPLLTLNVRGPSYLGLTRSISWLLMPWLLTSPGHQQPWYWLCRICRSWSYSRKDFKYLCRINMEIWHKM